MSATGISEGGSTLWRVCWKSRVDNIVRTRWKNHDAALKHFKKARLRCNHDVWMESRDNNK